MAEAQKRIARSTKGSQSTAQNPLPAVLQDSEARYREFFENANDMLAIFSLDGTIVLVNRAVERLLGWTQQELTGQHYQKVTTPALAAVAAERTQHFLAGEKLPALFEGELLRKDGSVVPVEARTRVIRDETGTPVGFQGIYRDISERKAMEAARQQSEARYRTIFSVSPDFMYVTDAGGKLLDANPALLQRTGLSLEQMQQMHVLDFFAGENPKEVQDALAQLNEGQAIQGLEVQARGGEGQVATYEINAIPLYDDGEAPQILSLARDITERKRAEQALRESEERYRIIGQSISDYAFSFHISPPDIVQVEWLTDSFTRITGYPVSEFLDKPDPFRPHIHPDDRVQLRQSLRELQPDTLTAFEFRLRTKDGNYRWIHSQARAVADEQGQLFRLYGASHDITEAKQAEEEIRENRRLRERIADTIPDILYLYDLTEQALVYVNRQLFNVLGYPPEEYVNQPGPLFCDVVHPDDGDRLTERETHIATAADGTVIETAYRLKHANGEWRWLLTRETIFARRPDGTPAQVLGVAQDTTERKRLEELLQERVIDKQQMPGRLREFRLTLRLSQAAFGKTFGGYNQSQISAYELGEVEVPLKLVLAIRAKGYPIEAVIGGSGKDVVHKTATYLPTQYQTKLLSRRLAAALVQLLAQDCQTIEEILHGLGFPVQDLTVQQQRLLDQLMQDTTETD